MVLKGCHGVRLCHKCLHSTDVLLFLLNLTRISKPLIFFYKRVIKCTELRSKLRLGKKDIEKDLEGRGISFIF
jgi:hypothetical protein